MVNLRSELRAALADAIQRAHAAGDFPRGPIPDIPIEYPPAVEGQPLGDYASPVSLTLGREWKRKPADVAAAIVKHFAPPAFVRDITVAGPGFLNVRVSAEWLATKIDDVVEEGPAFGRSDAGKGVSVNLEFVSANPTGMPHVGNGRALFVADTLGRILEYTGYAVTREYYVNDVGAQVAKYGESVLRRILQDEGHGVDFPDDLYHGEEVRSVAGQVREEMAEDRGHAFSPRDLKDQALLAEVTRRAVAVTVREIRRQVEEIAGVRYDVWFHESTLHERGEIEDILQTLKKQGRIVERDGALCLKTTEFGDTEDRVIVKSSGERTYLASDIAYHREKFRRGFQIVADFWGADHEGHILPLRAGLEALGEDPARLRVVLAHMVRVVQAGEARKMSKRAGTAVPLAELLKLIGLSAARFFLTMKSLHSPLDLDLDLARAEREENPVYYAQYAYVRLAGIQRKAKEQNIFDTLGMGRLGTSTVPLQAEGTRLLALAFRLPEILEDVVRTWEVQRLPHYALEFARAVHRFYETVPVLRTEERGVLRTRLSLAIAAQTVLGRVFDLLGVEKREVM